LLYQGKCGNPWDWNHALKTGGEGAYAGLFVAGMAGMIAYGAGGAYADDVAVKIVSTTANIVNGNVGGVVIGGTVGATIDVVIQSLANWIFPCEE